MKLLKAVPVLVAAFVATGFSYTATFTVNTSSGKAPISKYIYGVNIGNPPYNMTGDPNETMRFTAKRLGGNNLTAYNWEDNYTNSGAADGWNNSNADAAGNGFPAAGNFRRTPGIVQDSLIGHCKLLGIAPVIQLQLAGYVAADPDGQVTSSPPSSRWKTVLASTPGYNTAGFAFPATPVLTDSFVYMDEFVHHVVVRNGVAPVNGVARFYELDNESDIWQATHPVLHPAHVTCMEYLNKSIQTAAAVKRNDPGALVIGPSLCCFYGYLNMQSAPDWNTVKGSHPWFVSWYLQKMKQASDSVGVRLLDVMDLHLYPDGSSTTYQGFVQDPRVLWDPTYAGNTQEPTGIKPFYPHIISDINTYYPGTRFGCTEWHYGDLAAGMVDDIQYGLTTSDVLGIDGKYGSYLRTQFSINALGPFSAAGFRMYRNYDGLNHGFGDTTCASTMSDATNSSIYSSIEGQNLHIIILNKNQTSSMTATVAVTTSTPYTTGEVWSFGGTNSAITKAATGVTLSNGSFSYTIPAETIMQFIFKYGTQSVYRRAFNSIHDASGAGVWMNCLSHQVCYEVPGAAIADIVVSDAAGHVVHRETGVTGSGHFGLGRNFNSNGVYFATISTDRGTIRQKLVVAR